MDFDEILEHVGGYGRYQKRIIAIMAFSCILGSCVIYEPVFQSYEPDHWCATTPVDGWNCSDIGGDDAEQCVLDMKYDTIPHTISTDNETVFSQCTKYSEPMRNDSDDTMSTIECDVGWEYDTRGNERSIVTEFDLVCGRQILLNFAHAACFMGVSLGTILYGILADKVGRMYTFYLTVVPTGIISILLAFSPNMVVFMALRALIGASGQSISMMAVLIATEVVTPAKRIRAGFIVYFGWSIGSITLVFVAYFVRDWRLLQLLLSIPAAAIIFYIPFLKKSPRWLLSTGRNRAASKIVRKISVDNRNSFPERIFSESAKLEKEIEATQPEECTMVHLLRRPRLLGRTIINLHNWFLICLGYTTFYLYSDALGDVYINFAMAAFAEVPASLLTMLIVERVGRKKFIIPLFFTAGISCLLISILKSPYSLIFVLLGKFSICSVYNINIIYTSEVYPTRLRGTTGGLCNSIGRLGQFVCPMFIILGNYWKPLPLVILGVWCILSSILFLVLPETHGKKLPSTIQEAEDMGRKLKRVPTEDTKPEYV